MLRFSNPIKKVALAVAIVSFIGLGFDVVSEDNPSNAQAVQMSATTSTSSTFATSSQPLTPRQLEIPAINVASVVEPVGVNQQGNMVAPSDWRDVSWYQPGFKPGERGNAVFSGHLDWDDRQAVFWELDELTYGDIVRVSGDNRELIYMITDSRQYDYQVADTTPIFGKSPTSQIKLITCDGEFIEGSDTYQKRLILIGKLITTQDNQPLPTSTESIQTKTI